VSGLAEFTHIVAALLAFKDGASQNSGPHTEHHAENRLRPLGAVGCANAQPSQPGKIKRHIRPAYVRNFMQGWYGNPHAPLVHLRLAGSPARGGCKGVVIVANPGMLTLLREAKGWNQGELAEASGLTQSFVSRAERGFVPLSGQRLDEVAAALDCPAQLLAHDELAASAGSSTVFHRRRRSRISVVAARRFEATSHLTRLTVDGLMQAANRPPVCLLERTGCDVPGGDPAEVATALRQRWQIPDGPITDVCALLDRVGIVVVVRRFDVAAQDAMSLWPRDKAPSIVARWGMSVDRLRFTLCHELAHLAMHVEPGPHVEQEADRFAAEFLLPAADVAPLLQGLTTGDFDRLIDLKRRWRVSIATPMRSFTLFAGL